MIFPNLTLKIAERINDKYPRYALMLQYLSEKGCPMCKFYPKDYDDFEFHMHSTHGIPREMIVMWIQEMK